MRGNEMFRRRRVRVLMVITLAAVCALLVCASPVAAQLSAGAPLHRIGPPVRFWSVSLIEQGVGKKVTVRNVQRKGELLKDFDLGPVAFNFPITKLADRASGEVFSSADGLDSSVFAQAPLLDPFTPRSAKGGEAHLDEYQTYEKQPGAGRASLRITISGLSLETEDANGPLGLFECPLDPCYPIQTIVRYHAYVHKVGAAHDFYDFGGAVFTEGHQNAWFVGAATAADSHGPFWGDASFSVKGDVNRDKTGSRSQVRPIVGHLISFTVPLEHVLFSERFVVHVSMDAEAIDARGGESAAQAFIEDPQDAGPALSSRGLKPLAASRVKDPPVTPRPAARCPTGPRAHAGTVQLSSQPFSAGEGSGTALVLVTRKGGSRGATSVMVNTSGGTAHPGVDFKPTKTRVRFENGDTSPRLVEVPIREDLTRESPESFQVSLSHLRCAKPGKQRSASVTILDDDQPPPPPPPAFTIGGAVDGLQGSGLVLSNLGAQVPVSANGSFTFPGTASAGQGYEVNVKTQPSNPSQLCTVQNGKGTVSSANVTDIAVHCVTPAIPSGLDSTFGDSGRVSIPVGGNGQGEAVVIQPSGQIVTAGWRTVGTGIDTDFALTRNNPDGSLDTSFGSGGVATTDLGGADDQALDAALLPDGGIVAVGRTDALGILKTAFGVVRYLPDGTPDANFDTDGIVTTPFFGKGAGANAVAVQPDGKILVAGFADQASGFNSDFALARYDPDGTLDTSFDSDGIVTTDLNGQDDNITGLAIQPDGKIVAVGTAGDDVALARYMPDGKLDPNFGTAGFKITDLGFVDVANGVALAPGGQILLAGYTIGTKLNNDFLLERYDTDGTLDTTFGTGGAVKTDLSAGDDFAENLVVDAAGRIILVGESTSPTSTPFTDMALARYNADGTPDTGFATNGILTADFHGRGDFGKAVAIDPQGRIVAAGYTANGGDTQFALMRASP